MPRAASAERDSEKITSRRYMWTKEKMGAVKQFHST